MSSTYARIITVHVYLNGIFFPCRWLLWTSAVRRQSLRSWESTNSLSRPQVSFPTKTRDVHLHKQQQQQQLQQNTTLTNIATRIITFSFHPSLPRDQFFIKPIQVSLDQPSIYTLRDTSCIYEATCKSNFVAIYEFGATVDIRYIKPYTLWLVSIFQSLCSQSGFQNSAWGHFKTQHRSLSVAWLRSEHILEELCCWLWRAN